MSTTLEAPSASSATEQFLKQQHKLLINGDWVEAASGKRFDVINPASEDVIATVAEGDSEDVQRAVAAARKAFDTGPWSRTTPSERGKLLWKLGDLLEQHMEEFAEIEALDNGKPKAAALGGDVTLAIDMFRYMAGWATKIEGNTMSLSVPYMPGEEFHSYTLQEPVGVVGQIIPWNFPLLMAAWKLAPALAAGCTIVLKVAEETPMSAIRLGQLIQEVGFPPGVVNIITGYGETAGAALSAHPDVDKIAFTGSTEVGKLIVKAAGETNLKKITLELGGKSPNIILPDADIEQAIPGAANAIFFNHGQCCCAGSRLFVHKKQFDRVVEGISEAASQIRVGPGMHPDTDMGPMVSQIQHNRVCGYLESGLEEGARAVVGGKKTGDRGYFIEPTVLVDTQKDMKVIREEIFGPVVAAVPFDDLDELVDSANDTQYGLAAAVWTRDISLGHKIARRLKAGTVWVNCYNVFDSSLPFGGYKQSGWGREMGYEAIRNYTQTKAVTVHL
ncbi:aldehyde dehydrogenase family protein [Rubinisphaera margarita]|uniref:aldehyde dehydrogenase family protein n=1 Tax=Rubinisphaera margarita TaxID=2909586 RepID=UPI001EE82029|nr:aldehyde dehydrogenase family protein [Rubinisphaera margarita]MCG6157587.1 aldehyde dehydrogenase family protein [Rubinisphaera margarita]